MCSSDLKTAVQRYNLFSGGGCLPPLWGLGVYYRGHTKFSAAEVLSTAKLIRDSGMPCDVFGLEPNTIHFRIFRPVHGGRARDRVLGAQGNVLRTRFTQRMLRRPVLGLTLSRAMSRRIRS